MNSRFNIKNMKLKRKHRVIIRCLVLTVGLYMLNGCANNLFYVPDSKEYHSAPHLLLDKEEIWFDSSDGTKLHGWFIPAQTGESLGTIIHYHGNAQNLSSHVSFSSWFTKAGYNLFIFDYRGYGKSEGSVDKEGIHLDSVAALKYILTRPELETDKLIVLGQSLGGNNALAAIDEVKPPNIKAVIVDSTFYSYREIGKDVIGKVPLLKYIRTPLSWLLLDNNHSAKDTIHSISPAPLLMYHDKGDNIIPYHHSEMLYEIAPEPKELKLIAHGHHTSAMSYPQHRKYVLQWLNAIP